MRLSRKLEVERIGDDVKLSGRLVHVSTADTLKVRQPKCGEFVWRQDRLTGRALYMIYQSINQAISVLIISNSAQSR